MKRKLLAFMLVFLSIFGIMGVSKMNTVNAVDVSAGTKLYLTPNANWNVDSARFATYFFNGATNTWESMTKVEGETNLYEVTVPTGVWTNFIFCRMNPANKANNWDNKWNQTGNLAMPSNGYNCYTVKEGEWDDTANGTWSLYTTESTYDVTFICGSETKVVTTIKGEIPEAPTFAGYKVLKWDRELVAATEAATYTADYVAEGSIKSMLKFGYDVQTQEAASDYIYFTFPAEWDEGYVYMFDDSKNNSSWPGVKLDSTHFTSVKNGDDLDVFAICTKGYVTVIFSNGKGQTDNTTIENGTAYYITNPGVTPEYGQYYGTETWEPGNEYLVNMPTEVTIENMKLILSAQNLRSLESNVTISGYRLQITNPKTNKTAKTDVYTLDDLQNDKLDMAELSVALELDSANLTTGFKVELVVVVDSNEYSIAERTISASEVANLYVTTCLNNATVLKHVDILRYLAALA